MLSKEDKLKYGELLRQQMKQKEDKKKQEQLEKRGGIRKSPTDGHLLIEKQNATFDRKQLLQKRMETQEQIQFGRPGGGAPTKIPKQNQDATYNRQHTEGTANGQQTYNPSYGQFPEGRRQQQNSFPETHNRIPPQQSYIQNGTYGQLAYEQQQQQAYEQPHQQQLPMNSLQSQPVYQPEYQQQQTQNQQSISPPNYQLFGGYQPSQNQNHPQQQQQMSQGYYEQQSAQGYGNTRIQQTHPQYQQRPVQEQYIEQKRTQEYQPIQQYQQPPPPPPQQPLNRQQAVDLYQRQLEEAAVRGGGTNRQPNQNQEMMDMYKKGGRNLLKLQNQTAEELSVKQKQKLEMQKYLKLQIEEAERKKKEEKQRLRQEEIEEERLNLEYINRQNQKFKDEQKKERDKKQKIIEENERNLVIKRQMQQDAKKAKQERDRPKPPPQPQESIKQQQFPNQVQQHNPMYEQESVSMSSSSATIEQAFNTDVSKQFFKRERQKDPAKHGQDRKMEMFTGELAKMRDQINNQGVLFENELNKVKMEADRANQEKRRADMQIQQLKFQLKRKMEDDNQKLFNALNRNSKETYDSPPQEFKKGRSDKRGYDQYEDSSKPPMKPRKQQKLVSKNYEPPKLQETNNFGNGLESLVGDSKKIPLHINGNTDDLSMSRLSDYARQTGFFKGNSVSPKRSYQEFNVKQSIAEQQEERYNSRGESRQSRGGRPQQNYNQKDQLDRLVDSRQKSRGGWGQLSSVNSDITKQIEQLLKKKGNPANERPNSKRLESAGKQSFAGGYNQGIVYDGASLNTINSGGGGTFDLDRIQNKNDDRLRQLKNLGVETINTQGDDDLNRLDVLLNKYNG